MTIPASELAAWSELAEKAKKDDLESDIQYGIGCEYHMRPDECNLASKSLQRLLEVAELVPRLIAAYSQSQARVAELEKAIVRHQRSRDETKKTLSIDFYGPDLELWSVLPQSEGAT